MERWRIDGRASAEDGGREGWRRNGWTERRRKYGRREGRRRWTRGFDGVVQYGKMKG